MTPPRVLIANISRGHLSVAFVNGVIASLRPRSSDPSGPPVVAQAMFVESGPYLDQGRNRAVANALTLDTWDWLLFIDSDIEFTPDDIDTLLAPTLHPAYAPADLPVIAGTYVNPFNDGGVEGERPEDGQVGPVVYDWKVVSDLPGLEGHPTETFRRISRADFTSRVGIFPHFPDLLSVGCVGTGFMAIHRSLLTMMEAHYGHPCAWFHEPIVNSVHMGEDMGFCHRVLTLGYPVLVNRAAHVTHAKTIRLR